MLNIDNEFKIRIQYEWLELKKKGYQNNKVYIKEIAPKGLGVFAKHDIKMGEVVEMCHTFTAEIPSKYIQDKNMSEYMLPGVVDKEAYPSFAFGFGCIYNSSESEELRNVEWVVIPESRLSAFIANRDIKQDEEVLAWFGEGFYKSRCLPNIDKYLYNSFHKKVDEKLAKVILPNNQNLMDKNIKKFLKLDIINKDNFNIELGIENLDENTKTFCENKLKEIKEIKNINVYNLNK